jgi:hypothetical protein
MSQLNPALRSAISKIKVNGTADVYTIEAGKEAKLAGKIELLPGESAVMLQGSSGRFTFDQIYAIALIIDELSYAESTYDNIVRQRLFRLLYQVAQRGIQYVDGVTPGLKTMDSLPCQNCGLLLPLSHMTIDHVRPQTGGEVEAVAKVLRILGFTMAGPTSPKSQQLQAGVQSAMRHQQGLSIGLHNMSMERVVTAVPTKPGRGPKVVTSTVLDRYSLNWEGYLFYSLVKGLGCITQLQTRCMHSLVNLKPLCGPCNGSRGNPLKFV